MTEDEKYLFDLNGYLVIENVLSEEEVAVANEAIDRHLDQGKVRDREQSLDGGSPALRGEKGRGELMGMMEWEKPWCDPFRELLAHPTLVPYLNEILGKGFRVDHQMFFLWMEKGAEGFIFHGSSGPGFDPNQYYIYRNGKMHNGLTVVTFQLTDVNPGDGGLIVIPGSHKSNIACPQAMRRYEKYQEHVRQVVCKAGDVVIFTEAVTHGTLPWTAEHPRRSLLTRYTAGNMAYVPAKPAPEWADERVRVVMEPPYHTRLKRPVLEE
ncbi:MAG: phytanoyl-CoA dioxygenase family protein [bacterium]|nr:phytanoyl-CoA dioxygenase family protein [bacterium]